MDERIFPCDAHINRVLGILKILYGRKGTLDIRELIRISKLNHSAVMPLVHAAQLLGVVEVTGSRIKLTKLGYGLNARDLRAMEKVGGTLQEFEPFKSAAVLIRETGHFSMDELEDRLNRSGIMLHSNIAESEGQLKEELIQWAVFFGILNYNGVEKEWIKARN